MTKKEHFICFTKEEIKKLELFTTREGNTFTSNGEPLFYLNEELRLKDLKNFLKKHIEYKPKKGRKN